MELKAGIFDLDGVIVNTVKLHFGAWQKMFSEYGRQFSFEDYKDKVDGIPRIDGARAILSELSKEDLVLAADKKQGYFLELLKSQGVVVYDSTVKLIKDIKGAGIKTAVISSSKNCKPILEKAGLIDLFDVVFTGNDVAPGRGKPHPDVFLKAAEFFGFQPCECIVFEDAVSGIEAAVAGNFKCIGIDRYSAPERLAKSDIVVNDLSEIDLDKLRGLF
ncbi:MAG: beta-phosphoglucomutase family hydrolase [Candidatus Omnitrophica bacterium]|nr:beta-phosphoglucomutase family hydrolase [Candidatus Omnitrophota bacterium]